MKHAVAPLARIIHVTTRPERQRESEGEESTLQQWIVGTDVWFLRRMGLCFGWVSNFDAIWYFSLKARGDLEPGKINKGGVRNRSYCYGVGGESCRGPPWHPSQWHFSDCQISSPVQTHLLSLCMNKSIWGSHHPAHGRAPSYIHNKGRTWKWDTW